MTTFEEIRDELRASNKGETPIASMVETHTLAQLGILKSIFNALSPLKQIEFVIDEKLQPVPEQNLPDDTVTPPPGGDADDSDVKSLTALEKLTELTQKMYDVSLRSLGLEKNKALQDARKATVKNLKAGMEEGDVVQLAKNELMNPFLKAWGAIKLFAAQAAVFFGKIGGFVLSVTKLMTRAFAPLLVIFTGITEALEDFEDEDEPSKKLLAGVNGLVVGMARGVGILTDWIVDLTAKVLRFFGYEDAADAVESIVEEESMADKFARWTKEITEKLNNLGEWVGGVVFDVVKFIEDIPEKLKKEKEEFLKDPLGKTVGLLSGLTNLLTIPLTLLKNAVGFVADLLGFEELGTELFLWEPGQEIKDLLKKAVDLFMSGKDWVVDKIEELSDKMPSLEDVTKFVQNMLKKPEELLRKAFDSLMESLTWENIKAKISGAGDMIKKVSDKISGLLKSIEDWVIDKLNFLNPFSDNSDVGQLKKDSEASGVVDNPTLGRATADPEKLKEMSVGDLQALRVAWEDYPLVVKSIDQELGSRPLDVTPDLDDLPKVDMPAPNYEVSFDPNSDVPIVTMDEPQPSRVGSGTIATAINPAPEVPLVLQSAANSATSSGNIVGLGQEAAQRDQMMVTSNTALNESRSSVNNNNSSANVVTDASSSNYMNSVVNNYSMMPTPTHDTTDQQYIYRSAGTR